MATVATVQANGPGPEHHIDRAATVTASSPTPSTLSQARATSPSAQSVGSIKRKRDNDADHDEETPSQKDDDAGTLVVAPSAAVDPADIVEIPQQSKTVIAGFYTFLRSIDLGSTMADRALRHAPSDEEPPTKRPAITISDKVSRNEYDILDDLVMDLFGSIQDRISELDSTTAEDEKAASLKTEELAKLRALKRMAVDQYRRDTRYPRLPRQAVNEQATNSNCILKVTGLTGTHLPKPLFSTLSGKGVPPNITEEARGRVELPTGVEWVATGKLSTKVANLTLGDVFSTPQNRPRLLPPKPAAPKLGQNLPKAGSREILTWHHPELEDRSKPNSFSNQSWPCGYFIDYGVSQAPLKTRQRERAQSLAGHRPSTSELIVAEHDSLFRQTCLSFAPSFDNSGAIVTARQAARFHWQKFGQYGFYKEVESICGTEEREEVDEEEEEEERYVEDEVEDEEDEKEKEMEKLGHEMDVDIPLKRKASDAFEEIDEHMIKEAIDMWEDMPVDPALLALESYEKTERSALHTEEDIDHVLTEISDLILTLESMQHIRESSKGSGAASRLAGANDQDMLTTPSSNHTPSAEEIAKYKATEKRLVKLVGLLPPFEVAKLDGDQLNDLLVSTRIAAEVATYSGTMEEDEVAAAARRRDQAARQQAAAASQAQRPPAHRAASGPSPFPTHPHSPHHANNAHYATANRASSGTPQQPYFRQQNHALHTPAPPRSGPPANPPPAQQRPTPAQAHRPGPGANGYTSGYVPQLANTQTPYGHQGMQQYTPGQRSIPTQHSGQFPSQPQHQGPHAQLPQAFGSPQSQVRTPDPRFQQRYSQGYQTPQQPSAAGHPQIQAPFPNGMPQRTASPQVPHQQPPQQYQQRYPGQAMNRNQMPNMMNNAGMHGGNPYAHMTEEQRRAAEKMRFEQSQGMQPSPPLRQPQVAGLAGIGLGVAGSRMTPVPRPSIPGAMSMGSPAQRPIPNGLQAQPQQAHKVSPIPRPAMPAMTALPQHGQQVIPPRHHSPMQMQGQSARPNVPLQQMHQQQQQQMAPHSQGQVLPQAMARAQPSPVQHHPQQPLPQPQGQPQGQQA